ncbi:MAG: hypothetical protein KAR83_01325 [Thermodesulfovibrionales bacterium]|nr:hypothetical protein [Thermodesulfovibrionales bacterium]
MNICALCGSAVEVGREVSRKEECPSCSGDLRICLNCKFYSETAHNKCTEPRADFQRSRDRANFCDYFKYKEGGGTGGGSDDAKAAAKNAFGDLFK